MRSKRPGLLLFYLCLANIAHIDQFFKQNSRIEFGRVESEFWNFWNFAPSSLKVTEIQLNTPQCIKIVLLGIFQY